MVSSKRSGVIFTVDPATTDTSRLRGLRRSGVAVLLIAFGCAPSVVGGDSAVPPRCNAEADCQAAVSECRKVVACADGRCVFEDAAEGTPIVQQVPGDCSQIVCLGYGGKVGNYPNQMGAQLPAVDLGSGQTADAIAVGLTHACALLHDGRVKCWGANSHGELGLGDTQPRGGKPNEMGDNLPAVDLGTGKTAKAITAATYNTCALLDDNTVKCWGDNDNGELGLGHTSYPIGDDPNEMGDNLPSVDLGTGKIPVQISSWFGDTCVLFTDGSVKCWGPTPSLLGQEDQEARGDEPNEMGDFLPPIDLGSGKTAQSIGTASSVHAPQRCHRQMLGNVHFRRARSGHRL